MDVHVTNTVSWLPATDLDAAVRTGHVEGTLSDGRCVGITTSHHCAYLSGAQRVAAAHLWMHSDVLVLDEPAPVIVVASPFLNAATIGEALRRWMRHAPVAV